MPVNYAPKDRKQLWKAAIKLPMYSVGVVPVLVGAAAAYLEHSMMPWARVVALLVGSICVIAWLNLRWVFTACGQPPPPVSAQSPATRPVVLLYRRGTATCETLLCPCVCSNDAFDASTGVDVHKAESVVNLTGNRNAVLLVSKLFLLAGVGLLGTGIAAAADARVSAMLAAAIVCGYVYQGPPFRCVCLCDAAPDFGRQQVLFFLESVCDPQLLR